MLTHLGEMPGVCERFARVGGFACKQLLCFAVFEILSNTDRFSDFL